MEQMVKRTQVGAAAVLADIAQRFHVLDMVI